MKTSWLERGGFWDKGKKQAEKPELPVIREIPVESIRPNPAQPRLSYESGALEELAESIRENGLIQPILVRQLLDGDYELIAGHRGGTGHRRSHRVHRHDPAGSCPASG